MSVVYCLTIVVSLHFTRGNAASFLSLVMILGCLSQACVLQRTVFVIIQVGRPQQSWQDCGSCEV